MNARIQFHRDARCWCALASLATTLLFAGCVSIDQLAPRLTGSPGLTEGRKIYTTQCTSCHAAEPVRKYTAAEWDDILPRMIPESKLSPAQASALKQYVAAVLATPES